MKKYVAFLVLLFYALSINAQLYTRIRHYDKFDDVIKDEIHKTLITKTDSTFIVEEKGRPPQVYYILNVVTIGTMGDENNIVNLIDDLYGYQTTWCVIKYEFKKQYDAEHKRIIELDNYDMTSLTKYWLFATHRVVSKYQSFYRYDGECFWIQNETPEDNRLGEDVNRIIYIKQ